MEEEHDTLETGESASKITDGKLLDVKSIYDWSCRLPAETDADQDYYVWTEPVKQVLTKLEFGKGQMIFIIGYQGLGKTRAMHELHYRLANKGQHVIPLRMPSTGKILDILDDRLTHMSDSLKRKKKKDRLERIRNAMSDIHGILLDLPDYGHKDFRLMSRDLNEIQHFWNDAVWFQRDKTSCELNLVAFIQREMFDTRFHFLYGKGTVVELIPLSEQQLIDNYVARFSLTWPFTDDAIRMLARLARGNVRRFKRYISLCIEKWLAEHPENSSKNQISMDTGFVARSVTADDLLRDMQKEIEHIFPQSHDAKKCAMDLILLLSEKGELNEIQITENLSRKYNSSTKTVSPNDMQHIYMRVSRIIKKLETYNYLKERKGEGNSKFISLV